MKIGDLVRHTSGTIGVIVFVASPSSGQPALASVYWGDGYSSSRLYRNTVLEVVNESW